MEWKNILFHINWIRRALNINVEKIWIFHKAYSIKIENLKEDTHKFEL